jgi:DNA mismatch repair protein MutH
MHYIYYNINIVTCKDQLKKSLIFSLGKVLCMKYVTKESILIKSKEAIGKKFGDIDKYNRLSNINNKGNLGQVIEESFFEYQVNSNKEPDFREAGVELKVTPVKLNRNGSYSAKERLVLNIIDYNEEVKLVFENSSFWKKNKTLLLMFYLHDFEKLRKDMSIFETILFEYPKNDLEIIRNDYESIHKKIEDGEAHLLSESDTLYLAACTKGSTSESSYRTQPNSTVLAKQRAFSLKQSYMTSILRQYIFGKKQSERIIKDINQLKGVSFEDYIKSKLNPYKGKTVIELYNQLNIKTIAKSKRAILISKLLNVTNVKNSDEFVKAGIKFKTVLINRRGKIKENMSFPHFDFIRLAQESWEESDIKDTFDTTRFVFAVFRENQEGVEYFDKIVFWTMPEEIIENDVREVWQKTKDVLNSGEVIKAVKYNRNSKPIFYNNFPNSKDNKIIHVRPHARDGSDTLILPTPDMLTGKEEYTKQCFWLHRNYILKIIDGDDINAN